MRRFDSPGAFAAFLGVVTRDLLPAAERRGLEKGAALIAEEARAEIGVYQDAAGPFPAWAPLAPATQAGRVAKGFTPNDPLLRSGELRDSIGSQVEGNKAVIGTALDIGVYMEFGTANARHPIPPRPFLGPAAVKKGEDAANAIGLAVAGAVAGKPAEER